MQNEYEKSMYWSSTTEQALLSVFRIIWAWHCCTYTGHGCLRMRVDMLPRQSCSMQPANQERSASFSISWCPDWHHTTKSMVLARAIAMSQLQYYVGSDCSCSAEPCPRGSVATKDNQNAIIVQAHQPATPHPRPSNLHRAASTGLCVGRCLPRWMWSVVSLGQGGGT